VSLHPLIELSTNREVKQAKGFKQAAAELNGEKLEALYQQEVGNAPRRGDEDKKFLDVKTGRVPTGRQAGKDDRHLALAVAAWAKATGEGVEMPAGDKLEIVDSTMPLRTAAPDRSKGDDDPNKGVEDIDLIGLLPDCERCSRGSPRRPCATRTAHRSPRRSRTPRAARSAMRPRR